MSNDTFVIVKYDYSAQDRQELSIQKNERLRLIDDTRNWWQVENDRGIIGYVPSNYVRKESFVEKAKESFKGFGKPSKSKTFETNGQSDFNAVNQKSDFQTGRLEFASNSSNGTGGRIKESSNVGTSYAKAKYAYEPQRDDELRLSKGDLVVVIEKSSDGWWKGQCRGKTGWFPSNYVEDASVEKFSPSRNVEGDNSTVMIPPKNDIMEVVVAMYSFDAQSAEELSFQKGERLEIIDHPAHDPEWWMARNSRGETGLVPTNYIKVVDRNSPAAEEFSNVRQTNGRTGNGSISIPMSSKEYTPSSAHSGFANPSAGDNPESYSSKPWFYGKITRVEADAQLNARGDNGDFLVRDSESNPGDYSVSLKSADRNKHFKVEVDKAAGKFKIGTRTFASLDDLIKYYMSSPIYTNDKTNERLFLIKPLRKY
ncbi:hypothetical protein AB6A40_003309 [Gnathostoma spinigerum]|uniref:Uncharacterized protein n=1 Tax=Gnathostoma spinigerum TaxID=75299 RepID=A0ABD6EAD5_9BILA